MPAHIPRPRISQGVVVWYGLSLELGQVSPEQHVPSFALFPLEEGEQVAARFAPMRQRERRDSPREEVDVNKLVDNLRVRGDSSLRAFQGRG